MYVSITENRDVYVLVTEDVDGRRAESAAEIIRDYINDVPTSACVGDGVAILAQVMTGDENEKGDEKEGINVFFMVIYDQRICNGEVRINSPDSLPPFSF